MPLLLFLAGLSIADGDTSPSSSSVWKAAAARAIPIPADGGPIHPAGGIGTLRGAESEFESTGLVRIRRLKGKHAAEDEAGGDGEGAAENAGANDEKGGEQETNAEAGQDTTADGGQGQGGQDDLPPANPPPPSDESPCVGATACAACREMARSVADVTNLRSTCAWTSGICSEVAVVGGQGGGEVDDFECEGDPAGAGGAGAGAGAGGEEDQQQQALPASKFAAASDGDDAYYDGGYDSGGSIGGILFMMAFFAGMFHYARTKLLVPGGGLDALARGRFATGGGDDDASTLMGLTWATGLTSRSGGGSGNAEMVPLSAATDDDEWGWEDGGGDIEQQSRAEHLARVKEEEDLHTALAMSLSDPSNSTTSGTGSRNAGGSGSGSGAKSKARSKRGGGRPQRSGSGSGRGGTGFSRSHSGGSTGSGVPVRQAVQSEAVPSASSPTLSSKKHVGSGGTSMASSSVSTSTAPAPAAKNGPIPGSAEDIAELLAASRPSYVPESNYISSLSKPKAPPPKKKAGKKKKPAEEDDIFASMGLSSAPKFASSSSSSSQARPAPARKAAATSTTSASTSASSSRPSTAASVAGAAKTTSLAATSEEMGDADWDEDSDLDDLLDD